MAVMPKQVIAGLNIVADGIYVDCTFGGGGHSGEILKRLAVAGSLWAFDKDASAEDIAAGPAFADARFHFVRGSYTLLSTVLDERQWWGRVNGIVMDLGVSSMQLDEPERGFSFRYDAPLDMRMDQRSGQTVAEWLRTASEREIADVIFRFGEESAARRIARSIVRRREQAPICTTGQLAALVAASGSGRDRRHVHPLSRTFQAMRIFINQELRELHELLECVPEALAPLGRLVVISFHSAEDRIVKRFIRSRQRGDDYPMELPLQPETGRPRLRSVGRMQRPNAEEVATNPRSRSAVLRIAERVQEREAA